MQNNQDWIDLVCSSHCCYYKPGSQEILGCRGVTFLMEHWSCQAVKDWLKKADKKARQDEEHEALLDRSLCDRCLFAEEDCDYRDPDGPDEAKPCGGYMVAGILLGGGVEEVEKALKKR